MASESVSLAPAVASYRSLAKTLAAEVDAELDRLTRWGVDCPSRLAEAIRYSLLAPGKRMRPQLALMACQACGCDRSRALPAAAAVEMIHAYSLIHDDLPAMDDDDLRRGRPTCHKQFDEATAILAGDALQALAFETLAHGYENPSIAAKSCVVLARAAGPMALVGGQADDLAHEHAAIEPDTLTHIHRRKTGALITASLRLGAIAAEANDSQTQALAEYGERLGLAFQIVDDLLDVQGAAENVGKATGKDAARGKRTFPVLMGVAASRREAERLIDEAIGGLSVFSVSATEPLMGLARYVLDRNH